MMTDCANFNINFNGIYKIKYNHNKGNLEELINSSKYIVRKSEPFKENKDTFLYIITQDNMSEEAFFENDLREKGISFWKSNPILNLVNKEILDIIFKRNKALAGKENWITK